MLEALPVAVLWCQIGRPHVVEYWQCKDILELHEAQLNGASRHQADDGLHAWILSAVHLLDVIQGAPQREARKSWARICDGYTSSKVSESR